jgi:hypothetical protein
VSAQVEACSHSHVPAAQSCQYGRCIGKLVGGLCFIPDAAKPKDERRQSGRAFTVIMEHGEEISPEALQEWARRYARSIMERDAEEQAQLGDGSDA